MSARLRQAGLSLVELMVSLVIGSILIFGAATVYVNSKKSYSDNEGVARLQETARFAMSVIEADVRMASYWGLLKGAAWVKLQAAQNAAVAAVANGADMGQCGTNFGVDLNTNLQGDNDGYVLSATRKAGCDTLADLSGVEWDTKAVTTADTLTVRRASTAVSANAKGTLQVCSSRVRGFLMSDGGVAYPCAGTLAEHANNLIVNAYYVDQNSSQQAGLPSLRRKTLTSVGGVPQFRDEEVIPGVEDMQVQFGIDPTGTTGQATRYVNPDAVPALSQVVAVRVWLLVRSDAFESGFTDDRTYEYGNRLVANGTTGDLNDAKGAGLAYAPAGSPNAAFDGPRHVRRLLISRTIQIRNALGT